MNPLLQILKIILNIFANLIRDEIKTRKTAETNYNSDSDLVRSLRARVSLAENRVSQTRFSDQDRPEN